jgi:very-short-patch-repair endonuclease
VQPPERAKELRRQQTEAERRVWNAVRAHRMEQKYRRQYPVGPFFIDIACVRCRLAIELDGGQHADNADYDRRRSAYLAQCGWRVLRFWNNDVFENMEGVLMQIRSALNPLPFMSPLPDGA